MLTKIGEAKNDGEGRISFLAKGIDELNYTAADFAGMTEEQMKVYSTIGGTPHLDGQYTVFGEVEEGLDVVEIIQASATGRGDRPVDDLKMNIVLCD